LPDLTPILFNDDNIYTLQATITNTHEGPLERLRKVLQTIGPAVAELFKWHFVIVTDKKALADKYAKEFGTELRGVYHKRIKVMA
jgi:hypothetical protein